MKKSKCKPSDIKYSMCIPENRKRWEPTPIKEFTDEHLDATENFIHKGMCDPIYMNMTDSDKRKALFLAGNRSLKQLIDKLNNEKTTT